ncbi:hypothetical protein JTE90_024173 [Oedothorax gibbosus]|uniref:Uncharacterized protein n=1 Tax=Oedothorax gibbosus TaxID=931172 RepID=A0AAV6UFD9_9ARAC|nr:hypothetical protein JTE90_024173 [Oedothorax gibbosus]
MAIVARLWTKEMYRIGSSASELLWVEPSSLENEINSLPVSTKQKPVIQSFVQCVVESCNQWLQLWRISLQVGKEPFNSFLGKLNLMENMRVTLLGTVDGPATAREILKSKTLNDKDAFRLACVNCLLDEVMSIWPRVQSYFVDVVYNIFPESECSEVQVFTRYALEDCADAFYESADRQIHDAHEADDNVENGNARCFRWFDCADAFYESALRYAVNSGNEVAADYFLNKIRSDKRREQVERVAQSVFYSLNTYNAMFVHIVISHLGPQQMCEYAKSHAKYVMLTLTQWPLCMFFYDLALFTSRHVSSNDLLVMLDRLIKNLKQHQLNSEAVDNNTIDNYKLEPFKVLFETVWRQTSHEKKVEVIGLMIDYDTSCEVRPVESLHDVLKGTRWVFDRVFVSSNALFEFLISGFRQNSSSLRDILYKYSIPSCKGLEDVEFMLMTYESQTFTDLEVEELKRTRLTFKTLS